MEMGRVDLGRVVLVPISSGFVLIRSSSSRGPFFVTGRLSSIIWYHKSILRRPLQIETTRSPLMAPLPSVLCSFLLNNFCR